jgi:hypothetical protein
MMMDWMNLRVRKPVIGARTLCYPPGRGRFLVS